MCGYVSFTTMNIFTCLHSRYFETGVCSVYLWDLDHGFAGVVLIKKAGDTEKIKGCWDSIHVVEVQVGGGRREGERRKEEGRREGEREERIMSYYQYVSPPLQEKAQGKNAHYKLTSTVMLWLQVGVASVTECHL